MAIKFDKPDMSEILEEFQEEEDSLTVCKLHLQVRCNTLFMKIPNILPDYSKIKPKQNIYFQDLNNQICIFLAEPSIKNYYKRAIQWYGNGHESTYIRVPIPIQLRKKYKLDFCKKVHLIRKNDKYECIFI